MPLDRSFVESNNQSLERMRSMAARLSDAELATPVGQHWTVAIVFAHLAFWDRRVQYVLDMTQKDGKLFIPEIDIFVNDLSLPFWQALPVREAVRIGLESAEAVNRQLEGFPDPLLVEIANFSQRWVNRGLHRGEHLDEADAALRK